MAGRILTLEPAWLSGRTLDALTARCREDHRAAVADALPEVRDRIVEAPRALYGEGERDIGRLAGSLFVAIMAEKALGSGRLVLAVVAILVFWALNGHDPTLRDHALVAVARRASGKRNATDRIAGLVAARRVHVRE